MDAELRPGVLFDVDGTLVDTSYLHTLAWARALRRAGEWAPMNAVHRLVGMGGDQLVPNLIGHELPEAHGARAEEYQRLLPEARAFPGAAQLLQYCHDQGLVVVLATSSPAGELKALRELIGAGGAVDAETTADDVEASKPDPGIFVSAIKVGHIDPRRVVAVGDSKWDVQAARAAGIGCVAVETGGFSQHELSEAGALHVYRDVEEILDQFWTTPLALLLRQDQP